MKDNIFFHTFWWDFDQETPNWQINWQHQKHHQNTVISLITVIIKATADCRNVHCTVSAYFGSEFENYCLSCYSTDPDESIYRYIDLFLIMNVGIDQWIMVPLTYEYVWGVMIYKYWLLMR